jgi:hypothetical protein
MIQIKKLCNDRDTEIEVLCKGLDRKVKKR